MGRLPASTNHFPVLQRPHGRVGVRGSNLVGSVVSACPEGKKEEPKAEPKKEEPKKEPAKQTTTGEDIINFFKGAAGAVTGFFGGAIMAQPTTDEGAQNVKNGIVGNSRLGKTGTSNENVANQLKQIYWGAGSRNDSPGIEGSSDPCEGYNWFRQALPHLAGTQWDPYARMDNVLNSDPSNPSKCGPNANPDPDGNCEDDEHETNTDPTTMSSGNKLSPDCDSKSGCGRVKVSEAQIRTIMRFGNPTNPCGLYGNTDSESGCGDEDDAEDTVPAIPAPDPDCSVCGGRMSMSSNSSFSNSPMRDTSTMRITPSRFGVTMLR